ncbi:MAG: carbohydrate kinase family protein [Acidimicrobiales bacterium]
MIVSCGEALVDVLPDGTVVPGGGPMNTAVAASRLGVPAAFLGRVSLDADGDRIWEHLVAAGVSLDAAERGREPTARAVVTPEPAPTFRFEGDGTADTLLDRAEIGPLGPGPHLIHGGTLGIVRGRTADRLIELIQQHQGLVSFDPNIRPRIMGDRAAWSARAEPWLARADLVKASDEDLAWMGRSPADLLAGGAAVVLRTLGGDGAEAHLADGAVVAVTAPTVEVVDTVGAGDSFAGAVLAALWRRGIVSRTELEGLGRREWRDLIEFAVTVATITVGRPGADPPTRAELG